jgi:hypothetical protein
VVAIEALAWNFLHFVHLHELPKREECDDPRRQQHCDPWPPVLRSTKKTNTHDEVRPIVQSSQGLAARERKRPIIKLAKDHHEYSSLIDDQQETRKCFFFFCFFLQTSSAIEAERARSLVRGYRLLSHHVRYAIALGKLKTPAPTMAVTLWKAEYHHLAFLELVTGNHSSTFLLLGTEMSCRRNTKQFVNIN